MPNGYARPELLVETDWLEHHLSDPGIRIVDCDERPAYARAHIPGAVALPNNRLKRADNSALVMTPSEFREIMEAAGIGDATRVICYDANNALNAARLWWTLRYFGHANAAVLNGGWNRWLAEGRRITMEPSSYARGAFTPKEDASVLATVDQVKERLGKRGVTFWDIRNRSEYEGTNARGNRRTGHIQGACHLEWTDLMDQSTGMVKPAAEARRLLAERGINPEAEVVTY
jgi:thiosulfate/3-mercaptopyruvate sulfurtransferase